MSMQPRKRTRASHPKVRTGCHTCKARRVKCDEQRPHCQKCLSTGRKCEGYKSNREWIVVVAPPLPITDGFEDDRSRRHFDYFRSQAVYELSWFLDGDHWGTLVLQESHSSAAVRHAVIALACSHEDFRDSVKIAAQAPQYAYAAQNYSKSIRHLIKETSSDAHESRLKALMCGLLFISIEILRGNDAAALNHLEGCLKIVREARARTGMSTLEGNCLEAVAHLYRDIIPMYARLDVQACMMLGRTSKGPSYPLLLDCPSNPLIPESQNQETEDHTFLSFDTTFEALESLFCLGNRVHEFTGYYPQLNHRPQSSNLDVHTEKFVLYGQFMQWDQAALALLNAIEGSSEYNKVVMMRAHQRTMLTLLESSVGLGECHLDASQWAFEDVVDFITELSDRATKSGTDDESSSDSETSCTFESCSSTLSIDSARSRTTTPIPQPQLGMAKKSTRPIFVLDAGIIFSLFWTAVKCRDGCVRRRAIALLEQSWQEGVWIGMIQAAIAKRVVEIEEEQPYEQNPVPDLVKVAADIREEVRVLNVSSDVDKARRRAKVVLLKTKQGWPRMEKEDECYECEEWVYW